MDAMIEKVFLIEDHDEALDIWRKANPVHLPLIHVDAHIDFAPYSAEPLGRICDRARSVQELKSRLEHSLAFAHYQKDFNKQTNIGNYIYPAAEEDIVGDFYWIIPGGIDEFKRSGKFLKGMLKAFLGKGGWPGSTTLAKELKKGIVSVELPERKLVICVLETLPTFRQKILLDIDTDFLVTGSILDSNNTAQIGKRSPWISPVELAEVLEKKVRQPQIVTIAYSVNGGYTPLKYKYLGDELAYQFAPGKFRRRLENNRRASGYFGLFCSTGKSAYYRKAVRLNPTYRVADNNYGPLYLSLRRFSAAHKEFSKILKADPENPACFAGLGAIALARSDFEKAKRYYCSALGYLKERNDCLFRKMQPYILLGLVQAEFRLGCIKQAKERLALLLEKEPLLAEGYYLLGLIFEKEKEFSRAELCYKDAFRLGLGIGPLSRLLRISARLEQKDAIVQYVIKGYKEFKRRFIKAKRLGVKKRITGINHLVKRMAVLEKAMRAK
jgi:tetratricopeptide (TPR) repeat protein